MGQWWSKLNGYETALERKSQQLTFAKSYQLAMQAMFSDEIFNRGRIEVWFYVSQNVYKRLPMREREQCHELVLEWFSLFEIKCPDIHIAHLRNEWSEFRRRDDVLN